MDFARAEGKDRPVSTRVAERWISRRYIGSLEDRSDRFLRLLKVLRFLIDVTQASNGIAVMNHEP